MDQHVRFLKYYYLLTPVFVLADIVFGVNLRISIPGGPEAIEYSYYAVCFISAFFVFKTALSAAIFSLAECVINILLLALSVMWPIIMLGHQVSSEAPSTFTFGMPELIHFIIAGGVLIYAFHANPLIMNSKRLDGT